MRDKKCGAARGEGAGAGREGIGDANPAFDYPKEYPVGLFFRSRGENASGRILPGLTMGSSDLGVG